MSLILILVWALTLFIASLPKFWLFRQLPIWLGWPGAFYACWSLRRNSHAAKSASVAVLIATLLSVVRGLMPIQTLYSAADGTVQEISIPLLALTLSFTVLRDCATIFAMIYLGRLVAEIAEPIDNVPGEQLVAKSKSQFRWLAIGWTIAIIWAFVIAFSFALSPIRYAEILNGLPGLLRRLALSGHAMIKLFVSWNIVLLTFPMISRWHSMREMLEREYGSMNDD